MSAKSTELRACAAIAGIAETPVGRVPDYPSFTMYVDVVLGALADAGIAPVEVDALVTSNSRTTPHIYHADFIAEYLGIQPSSCWTIQTGGGTTIGALKNLCALIASGGAEVGVLAAADNLASGMANLGAMQSMAEGTHADYEWPLGATIPALYALIAQRHMHEFGTTREQMAAVAVAARKHAILTGCAHKMDPLVLDDVLEAKPIATPLHRHDCALISDGGAAIVVVSEERARQLPQRPAWVLGLGEARDWLHISESPNVTMTGARRSGHDAFAMAGVAPRDVATAVLYDAFSILPILFLEDLGFCERGEGGTFVEGGRIEVGGALPINTHGGLLSYAHPGRSGALLGVVEAVRQVRGSAGARQVPNADIVLVHAEGGIASCHGTAILGSER